MERRAERKAEEERAILDKWKPKTKLGRDVKSGELGSIQAVLATELPILETEIIAHLLPQIESDLLLIGQAKGKFGGGKRRAFAQTQKKTKEGNTLSFKTCAVVGNRDGLVGTGLGKARENIPAREKAIRNAKLNIMHIRRGCGHWDCGCKEPHSVPFKVKGSRGSCEIELMPAPKGTGLCVEKECQKILSLAGITDVWSKTRGKTNTKINLVQACIDALRTLNITKIQPKHREQFGIVEGSAPNET